MEYIKGTPKKVAAVLALVVAFAIAAPGPAEAWISCEGNTHYHYNYTIPTKHVNTGILTYINGNTKRVWEIKKDWDKNGSFQHVEYQTAYCPY
jgi:hypothetical protein